MKLEETDHDAQLCINVLVFWLLSSAVLAMSHGPMEAAHA